MCHIWLALCKPLDTFRCESCTVHLLWIVAEAQRTFYSTVWETNPAFWCTAGEWIGLRCFVLLEYLLYEGFTYAVNRVPNIGEVSFVLAISPLFEWNVPVFLMASRRSQAPQTSGPYALCHPSPPPLAMPLSSVILKSGSRDPLSCIV